MFISLFLLLAAVFNKIEVILANQIEEHDPGMYFPHKIEWGIEVIIPGLHDSQPFKLCGLQHKVTLNVPTNPQGVVQVSMRRTYNGDDSRQSLSTDISISIPQKGQSKRFDLFTGSGAWIPTNANTRLTGQMVKDSIYASGTLHIKGTCHFAEPVKLRTDTVTAPGHGNVLVHRARLI